MIPTMMISDCQQMRAAGLRFGASMSSCTCVRTLYWNSAFGSWLKLHRRREDRAPEPGAQQPFLVCQHWYWCGGGGCLPCLEFLGGPGLRRSTQWYVNTNTNSATAGMRHWADWSALGIRIRRWWWRCGGGGGDGGGVCWRVAPCGCTAAVTAARSAPSA